MREQLLDDRYRLVDHLGSGEVSSVWSAMDIRLDRMVAIKLFAPHATRTLRTAEALSATASAWAPGLTRVYDAVVDMDLGGTSHTVVVRELMEGATLADWVAGGDVPASAVAQVGAGVASTLACLHHDGKAHGSVRESNILVGQSREFRLADFGARQMLTGSHALPHDDVRGLGTALLSALTGRQVVGTRTARLALHRLRPDSGLDGRRSRAWALVLGRMVSDDRADQPSAIEAAAALADLGCSSAGRQTPLRARRTEVPEKPPWDVIFSV